ncbi:radical SAM protein [Ignavigranum ruoffiae]|uniref:radical SAM protein n=1 Tax=Ignavigranum ruoffiae TaxID=89093 RepID=UPI003B00491A
MHFSKFAVINYNLQKNTLNIFHLINKSVISVAFDFEIKGKSNEYLLEQLNSDQIDSLKNLDIICENKFFDYNKYEIQREMYKYSDKICRFVIHLNYDCNLSCSYCYQNVINKKIIMNDITLNQVNNFIIKVKRKIKPEALDVCFIGGEPTLHSEKILQIMKTINKNCNNIIYSIVTNGTYGNKRILKKLFKLGLNNFMITLDGPQKIHDYLRKDNNNRGSYQTIIRNLKKCNNIFLV